MKIQQVVSGGFCVGCGGCASLSARDHTGEGTGGGFRAGAAPEAGAIRMRRTAEKTWLPDLSEASAGVLEAADRVCPFSDTPPDETRVAGDLYGATAPHASDEAGRYGALLAGRIRDDAQVVNSSSGGLTSWFLLQLLARGEIDGVIHVGQVEADDPLFRYKVSHSPDEVLGRRKSQYYAVEFSQALAAVRGDGRRYAFVGVPCFVKAVRALCREDAALDHQIAWCIGLVCGHMKSGAFPEVLSDQLGVAPDDIQKVDFRVKDAARPANAYGFGVQTRDTGDWRQGVSREMVGGNWGHALFQLQACDFCDDIFAETADVCFGDAWLPRYAQDWRGTNAVVLRHPGAVAIFDAARAEGTLELDDLTLAEMTATQAGNFRHRREGLAQRLADAIARGTPVPRKRVAPGSFRPGLARRLIIRIRQDMAAQSHVSYLRARRAGDMRLFYTDMGRFLVRTKWAYRLERGPGGLLQKIMGRLRRTPR